MKFSWVTINVSDMTKSLDFYRNITGLKIARRMNPMPGTEIVFLDGEGTEIELIHNGKNKEPLYGKDISLGFEVKSIDETVINIGKTGISEIQGPFQPNPSIKFIYIKDPDGLRIQFFENIIK
jgi:lactoylglutathione lyase